jgi:hypothetical protein
VWITVGGKIIGWFVVCDNPAFKELFKAEEDQIFM